MIYSVKNNLAHPNSCLVGEKSISGPRAVLRTVGRRHTSLWLGVEPAGASHIPKQQKRNSQTAASFLVREEALEPSRA